MQQQPHNWTAILLTSLVAVTVVAVPGQSQDARESELPQIPLGLDLYMPIPEDNPVTPQKVALGRRLFFDPILSRDHTLSCASCHDPRRAFTDGRAVSVGVFGRKGTRSVPTLINRAYGDFFFWDGRVTSLEEQVIQPILAEDEMDMTLEEAVARVQRDLDYDKLFQVAFGRPIDAENLAAALASYVRTILSGNAPVDRYLSDEREQLSPEAYQGLRLFRGKANCSACHLGPTFTDERFHNTGIAWRDGVLLDPGRFAVTGEEEDRGAFKTPTLREVTRTAPYMHDGSLGTLEEVIAYYNRGGNPNPYLDAELRPLNLTVEEKAALLEVLKSLSGTIREGMSGQSPEARR